MVRKMYEACEGQDVEPDIALVCKANIDVYNKLVDIESRGDLSSQDRKELANELLSKSDRDTAAYAKIITTMKHYKLRTLQAKNRNIDQTARVQEIITNEMLLAGSGKINTTITISNTTLSNATYEQCTVDEEYGTASENYVFSKYETVYLKKNNSGCKIVFDDRKYVTDISNSVVNVGSGDAYVQIKRGRRSTVGNNEALNVGTGVITTLIDFPESDYTNLQVLRANYIFQQRNFSELKDPNVILSIVDPKLHDVLDNVRKHLVTVFINKKMEMFSRIGGYRYTIVGNICKVCSKQCVDVFSEFFDQVRINCAQFQNGKENVISVPLAKSTIIMNPISYCKFVLPKVYFWQIPITPVFECNTLDCNYMVNDELREC